MTTDVVHHVFVPEFFTEPADDAHTALMYASLGLRQYGRWRQGVLYVPADEPDPDRPFEGDWCACALGMLMVATVGVRWDDTHVTWQLASSSERSRQFETYVEAAHAVAAGIAEDPTGRARGSRPVDPSAGSLITVSRYNDHPATTLTELLGFIDAAAVATEPSTDEETPTE